MRTPALMLARPIRHGGFVGDTVKLKASPYRSLDGLLGG
jgi:hypothetical protein